MIYIYKDLNLDVKMIGEPHIILKSYVILFTYTYDFI